MKTRTINLIYAVSLIAIIVGGVFLLYGDVYYWITGNHLNDAQVLSDRDKKSQIPTIDTNALALKVANKEKFLLLDVRTLQEYEDGHIKEAVSMPLDQIDNQIGKLELAKAQEIITMCDGTGCNRADQAAAKLIGLGFSNVTSYHDGIAAWKLAGKPVVTSSLDPNDYIALFKDFKTQQITVQEAQRKIDAGNVVIVDVQAQQDYNAEHLTNAIYMDLSTTAENADSVLIPKGKTIIFYSEDGSRSNIATQTFIQRGYSQAYSMTGGIHAWKDAGLEVTR
jgi:rhodanese-related sulfurtransferase